MLGKLKNALRLSQKQPRGRQIDRIGYSADSSRLVVEFTDGTLHTHVGVIEGHIVGLRVAEDKLGFYESQIEPTNIALEHRTVSAADDAVRDRRRQA
jgi:KTSC domain